jgi:hypothetical protein
MSQTTGNLGAVIIPLNPDVILGTPSGAISPPGATAGAMEEPCDLPEQLSLFEEELGR